MLKNKFLLFIIGSPRSGTTWLQIILGSHESICTTVELRIFNKYINPLIKAWNEEDENIKLGRWHQGLPFIWSENQFYLFLKSFIDKIYTNILEKKPKAKYILDKHPNYSMHVDEINKLLPNARFIHLIRDGRDVVSSMLAAKKSMGFGANSFEEAVKEWKNYVISAQKAKKFSGRYI